MGRVAGTAREQRDAVGAARIVVYARVNRRDPQRLRRRLRGVRLRGRRPGQDRPRQRVPARAADRGGAAGGARRAARRSRRPRKPARGRQPRAAKRHQDAAERAQVAAQQEQCAPRREQGAPRPARHPLACSAGAPQAHRRRVSAADEQRLREWGAAATSRLELWSRFVSETGAASVAEIGVYRGDFAARLLAECADISTYFMIDPWRHLSDWNKPANRSDEVFERYLEETLQKTSAWADKRVVLRGKTADVIHQVPDGALDFAYVDGDHTLRGITIDLVKVFPKVRAGGWI